MPKSTPKSPTELSAANNQLRIIGGQWRGRKLNFPAVAGLRPTGNRIRETLFNWLASDIHGASCLDLFAGSGALGLEALSRGAGASLLIERDPKAASQLKSNLNILKANGGNVMHGDALSFLKQPNSAGPYDIIFIDPPFELDLWQATINALEEGNHLSLNAKIYIESTLHADYETPGNWRTHRDKIAGKVAYRLFCRTPLS